MKFGHNNTQNLSSISWQLPEDSVQTKQFLASLPPYQKIPQIYIGCAVFTDPSFVGTIYPPKTKSKNFLSCYTKQFNALELNSTFYGIPPLSRILQWKKNVTKPFHFCPKFPQFISHQKNIYKNTTAIQEFINRVSHFDQHLGMPFLQLPPFFHPNDLPCLKKFLDCIPHGFPLAVELRNPDWFNDEKNKKIIFDCLQKKNITWVITDTNRRDVLHQMITTDTIFIRFKGNDLHQSDFFRLDQWIKKIFEWIEKGIQKIYFFVHTMKKHLCIYLTDYLIKGLKIKNPIYNLKKPIIYPLITQSSFL